MSAQIIPFPGTQARRREPIVHEAHVLDAARRVESLALRIYAGPEDQRRLVELDEGVKLLPGGRQELRDFISVLGADPYLLAVSGCYVDFDLPSRPLSRRG